jgi:hypothetical protein
MSTSYIISGLIFLFGLYMLFKREGFLPNSNVNAPCPPGYEHTNAGDCKVINSKHDGRA